MVKPIEVNLKMESLMVKEFVISLMEEVIRENSLKEELRVKGSINFQTEISQKGYGRTINPVSYTHLTLPTKRIV